jgi:transposase InsO family protein
MSIANCCKLLGYSKQAYFKGIKNEYLKSENEQIMETFILEKVDNIRQDMNKIGGLKLFYLLSPLLKEAGMKIGRDKFMELLKRHKKLIIRKKRAYKTTDSSAWRNQYDNLIEGIVPTRPEQIWVADITYFLTEEEGSAYGHFLTDAYSKKIMGFNVSIDMLASSTLKALKMGISNRMYAEELTHHSDRGSQYCAALYTKVLKKYKIKISMTQDGSPYDNAIAERLNRIMKEEFGLGMTLKNLSQAKAITAKAVQIYNSQRPHWSNHLLTPNEMHAQSAIKIKTWRKKN